MRWYAGKAGRTPAIIVQVAVTVFVAGVFRKVSSNAVHFDAWVLGFRNTHFSNPTALTELPPAGCS